jgi:hypothetical protein
MGLFVNNVAQKHDKNDVTPVTKRNTTCDSIYESAQVIRVFFIMLTILKLRLNLFLIKITVTYLAQHYYTSTKYLALAPNALIAVVLNSTSQ